MATIKEQDIVLVSKEPDGTKVIQMPITRVENVEGGVATVNGIKPDTSKNVVLNEVNKAKEATHAVNADNATKATQDANGKIISTTYATKTEVSKKQDSATAFTKAAADNLYLGKTDTAVNATKALQDHTGNNIVETYATKVKVKADLNAVNDALTEGLAGKEDKGTCLPLTGGQLLGDLFLLIGKLGYSHGTGDNALSETILGSDPFIEGTDNIRSSGAFLALRNHACMLESVKGSFALATREANGDIPIYLEGFRDGGLFWGGKPIIREVSEGRNTEGGNYFVSFSNGLKIQTIFVHSTVSPAIVNYWIPFTQPPAIYVARIGGYPSLDGYGIEWGPSGNTSAKITKAPGQEGLGFFLLAIGY